MLLSIYLTTILSLMPVDLPVREMPSWFDESKFGIMIHWGVYSVPAWSYPREIKDPVHWTEPLQMYSEWYWHSLEKRYTQTLEHHESFYGDSKYPEFASGFQGRLFDPEQWARMIRNSGAGYVVLVAKHHDGFALWPSEHSWNWNSMALGPKRDIVGELTMAVKSQGLKMGISYSLDSWFDPLYIQQPGKYSIEKMIPQLKELVMLYHPDILVAGGHGRYTMEQWGTQDFLAWLYKDSPVKESIVVNQRWGKDANASNTLGYTTFQNSLPLTSTETGDKWEVMQSISKSYGYSISENIEDYLSAFDIIALLTRVVASGGNLLLNIGPDSNGKIPVIMQDRLREIGDWLRLNGEAIYETRPLTPKEGIDCQGTRKDACLYLFFPKTLPSHIPLNGLDVSSIRSVRLLGFSGHVGFSAEKNGLKLSIPVDEIDFSKLKHVFVIKIELKNE